MAICIVRCDEEELLAEATDQLAGDGGGVHRCCIADAKDVPFAVGAGDRVGVTAGDDVEDFEFAGDLRHGVGDAGVHVAEDDVDLVTLDQLAGFLHAGADVVGGVFDQKFDLTAENTVLFVQSFDGVFGAFDFTGGEGGEDAGQGIDHADADRRFAAGADDRRRGEGREGKAGLEQRTTAECR